MLPADAAPDAPPSTPDTLADTGLCLDAGCTQIAPDVRAYRPQYELYSDGATKRRWIQLPPGATIDTTDMNHWVFPVGTRLWKEFTRDGIRVETRYLEKLLANDAAPGAWFYATYAWNATQDAATLASPQDGVQNANGTAHDIPTRTECRQCHEGVPGRVLGFGAMSLDYDAPTTELDLADAVALGLLSAPPSGDPPYFPLPGFAVDRAAFGYLHANCGGCHNPRAALFNHTPVDLRLDVTKLGVVELVPAHATTVDVNGTVGGGAYQGKLVKPKDPDNSVLIIRMNAATFPPKMPQLGTETIDPVGQTTLRAWIDAL